MREKRKSESVNPSHLLLVVTNVTREKSKYEASPLRERHMAHRWQAGIGNCPGCNERGIENFLLKLDPRQWFDGLNSTTEAVTCALEIALIIASILATVLICTKCVIPLARCTISLGKPPKK
ncbi:unnamed protein product [Onchocerca ochengi]|uniref:Uncharacterized protein n=1 Tax=Onchocerca ochengi TaxID=42157 RepID=A0A182EGX3_ONCOC|nr:unnamed protein product [Onchocerca ochengi]